MIDNHDITNRLRCRYPIGPALPNGEPEFGWRDTSGPVAEVVLPMPINLEAAAEIERLRQDLAALREKVVEAQDWFKKSKPLNALAVLKGIRT